MLAVIIVLAGYFAQQVATLRVAHSSFENYAAFRGCAQITSRTPTEGTCTLASGGTIKIVQFRGRWFLDGDLPTCWGNICI